MFGLRGCWMPFFAVIPKADGDSTPLGQRPLSVLPVVFWLWASLRLGHLRDGSRDGFLSLSLVWVMVSLLWKLGLPLLWILRRFCLVSGDQLHVMVADVIKFFDTVDRSMLDCTLGRLGLPGWFRKAYFCLSLSGSPTVQACYWFR